MGDKLLKKCSVENLQSDKKKKTIFRAKIRLSEIFLNFQ